MDLDFGGVAHIPEVIAFARHDTFHPRFGWLKKGFDRAMRDERVFLAEDAPVRLGVGKNMVRSIRYWCSAFKILEDDRPTEFSKKLLGEKGWDSYLEDPASLWLLHWKFLEPPCLGTAWAFTFNQFRLAEFTQEDLFYQLCEYRDRIASNIADSSLQKDVSCLLRMYVEQPSKSWVSEDSLDCPFTELGLIHRAGDSRHYTFRIGYKPNLPESLIVYTCLCHANRVSQSARTISVANLLYDSLSPGLVLKLTESAICNAIEKVSRQFKQIGISDVAGKLQFFFEDEPEELADQILDEYYKTR
ncbi:MULTISPECIES: DUF4007 family protein [Spirulina sp. CCY15215]|uniref:DUF4007 family protein n=1 Tax=Spirulina sp. CCY15215 TaxID=2767591 RepID=UPI0032AF6C9D